MKHINPLELFFNELPTIQKPMRYLGGEMSSTIKFQSNFNIALCFPDLYEIGMSNNAMKIIYSGINNIEGVSCERVFSVADDFEQLLRKFNIGLYGLESGLQVIDFDILAFTIGFELSATNILNILDICKIPLDKRLRTSNHPIVIAGGPAISNPVPYTSIFDAVWIGEAEHNFFKLIEKISIMKYLGANRQALIDELIKNESIWIPGKKTIRNIFYGFSDSESIINFPAPVLKPVQGHGIVEIMRGCPNGCRFCHAGYFYRPVRYKNPESIISEVERLIKQDGHREISLSSLSTGDYPGIVDLVKILKDRWSAYGVSFQLPSLKIETFSIDLIEEISSIRKSGLTFAVETANGDWQKALNKVVSINKIIDILNVAVLKGYKSAKFYFMIGLFPDTNDVSEEILIIKLLDEILLNTKSIKIHITLATFVPKSFTPFQWNEQLEPEEANNKIYKIKDAYKNNQRIKISYNSPYLSMIEGIIARGDEGVGDIIINAFNNGAKFDSWDDLFKKAAWEIALANHSVQVANIMKTKITSEYLPWDSISLRVSKKYFKTELKKSDSCLLTNVCSNDCIQPCGSCTDEYSISRTDIIQSKLKSILKHDIKKYINAFDNSITIRILFNYSKLKRASYLPHHDLQAMISRAFELSNIKIALSQGFNPMPKLEISEPLPLGFQSFDEYGVAKILVSDTFTFTEEILASIKSKIHLDLHINYIEIFPLREDIKFPSLSKSHWGSLFELSFENSKFNLQSFVQGFEILASNNIELKYSNVLEKSDKIIEVLLPFTGKKTFGLNSIFSSLYGASLRESNIAVSRLQQFAKDVNGTKLLYLDFYQKHHRQR